MLTVLVIVLATAAPVLGAPTATLLKDIRTTGPQGSSPTALTTVGTRIFFQASDPTHGLELWESNGTTAGTQLVKDVRVGSMGSAASNLTNVAGTVYFTANDGTH